MTQRRSRKRRKQRRERRAALEGEHAPAYGRSRAKEEAARGELEPLGPGERPLAVTAAALVAAALCVANLVALVVGFDSEEGGKTTAGLAGSLILAALAIGMWRARYWAVLGMQTILALAIVGSSIALVSAANLQAVLLVVAIIVPSGVLFWFLVKAMARIQMPERPGARS